MDIDKLKELIENRTKLQMALAAAEEEITAMVSATDIIALLDAAEPKETLKRKRRTKEEMQAARTANILKVVT